MALGALAGGTHPGSRRTQAWDPNPNDGHHSAAHANTRTAHDVHDARRTTHALTQVPPMLQVTAPGCQPSPWGYQVRRQQEPVNFALGSNASVGPRAAFLAGGATTPLLRHAACGAAHSSSACQAWLRHV